jgi:hypothetical protein
VVHPERRYVDAGKTRIMALLDDQHALAGSIEIEARLSEGTYEGFGDTIDPHVLTIAINELDRDGSITSTAHPSRGGRDVSIIQPTDTRRRTTRIDRAAARKRLLMARYLGWSQGTDNRQGVIGPAGERAVRASLVESAAFSLAAPGGGPVGSFLGYTLPGALDSAGFCVPLVDDVPGRPIAVPIEVKNIRDWIYPASRELYQLLTKSVALQRHRLDVPICPVLICRRAHKTTFWMAKALGFYVVATLRQYIEGIEEEPLNEVRAELALLDLMIAPGPDDLLVKRFRDNFPTYGSTFAAKWAETASNSDLTDTFEPLRTLKRPAARAQQMALLRAAAEAAGYAGGW